MKKRRDGQWARREENWKTGLLQGGHSDRGCRVHKLQGLGDPATMGLALSPEWRGYQEKFYIHYLCCDDFVYFNVFLREAGRGHKRLRLCPPSSIKLGIPHPFFLLSTPGLRAQLFVGPTSARVAGKE